MRVSLFVTCLGDSFYPDVALSVVKVLRRQGIEVDFPEAQVCCGQPGFNSGHHREALVVASGLVKAFAGAELIVTPSGSCASMVRHYYPRLFPDDHPLKPQADAFAKNVYEFSEFMTEVLGVESVGARLPGVATYHHSCHMSRGLGVTEAPVKLLKHVKGLKLVDLPYSQDCCGFGGTFAIKLKDISEAMVDEKVRHIQETGADFLIGSDMACLMNIAGRMHRLGMDIKALHVAQVLDPEVIA